MDKEMLEQFQLIMQGMGEMEQRILQHVDEKIDNLETLRSKTK